MIFRATSYRWTFNRRTLWNALAISVLGAVFPAPVVRGAEALRAVEAEATQPAAATTLTDSVEEALREEGAVPGERRRFRKLAPGVLVTIDAQQQREESWSTHDVVELLAMDPQFAWAKHIRFSHDIWSLEFSFKPLRFLALDVPNAQGSLERKLVWYLVYRLRNLGDKPVRFIPRFSLEAADHARVYQEQLLPIAIPIIQRREDPARRLLNSVEITGDIPPTTPEADHSVWGVVTWTGVDPRTDRFSIFVQGLTNAYRWQDPAGAPRHITRKTLKMNFWRPGDQFDLRENEIRFGTPDDVDYAWIYR